VKVELKERQRREDVLVRYGLLKAAAASASTTTAAAAKKKEAKTSGRGGSDGDSKYDDFEEYEDDAEPEGNEYQDDGFEEDLLYPDSHHPGRKNKNTSRSASRNSDPNSCSFISWIIVVV
jgi:hypothetical protein